MDVGEGQRSSPDLVPAISASSSISLLLAHLPRLASKSGQIDFQDSDPCALVAVADAAEGVTRQAHHGLQALGGLLGSLDNAASQRQAAAALPGLGGLIGELVALAACCSELAARCRHETADYSPSQPQGGPVAG